MTKILKIPAPYAKCYENKHAETDHEPGLRFWRAGPDHATLAIDTHSGIGDFGNGKKRNMLSHLNLDRTQLLQLRDAIREALREIK